VEIWRKQADGKWKCIVDTYKILTITNSVPAVELKEFAIWLGEMEREKKDVFFYESRIEAAC
jgi:hypothetical protein